ncbi:phospholipid-transporting P-type ATPase [Blattamonas nauphoetae]|uniref:Phospholipid-transporting P-type ATPase n=1 Tax=Blattamonas nauphoetae TaxID=2049346 RepID=A0ABQ9X8R1_9EUKA|nr:phospholipid-transporting P-type ATPase [Blattamonas nauphoetae]
MEDGKPGEHREFIIGNPQNAKLFCDNRVRTSNPGMNIFPPVNQILPLVFILVVTALKDGFEDILRHITDRNTNSLPVKVLTRDGFVKRPCTDVHVGDVVLVEQNEEIPADMILLASSGDSGVCYVNTMNLDGEANLKTKRVPTVINEFVTDPPENIPHRIQSATSPTGDSQTLFQTPPSQPTNSDLDSSSSANWSMKWKESLLALQVKIISQPPNRSLTDYTGQVAFLYPPSFGICSLDDQNLVLKGCSLKNTEAIAGTVVFTGKETKVQLNSQGAKSKMSHLERRLNWMVIVIFVIDGLFVLVVGIMQYIYEGKQRSSATYLQWPAKQSSSKVWLNMGGGVILFSYLIPISLFVSIEFARIFQKIFMQQDRQMRGRRTRAEMKKQLFEWDQERIRRKTMGWKQKFGFRSNLYVKGEEEDPIEAGHMICRTTTLNEELGMISHIFTDKTGTLTQNKMEFKFCQIGMSQFSFSSESDPAILWKEHIKQMEEPSVGFESNHNGFLSDTSPITSPRHPKSVHHDAHSNLHLSKVIKTENGEMDLPSFLSTFVDSSNGSVPLWVALNTGQADLPEIVSKDTHTLSRGFGFITALLVCHDALAEAIDFEKEERARKERLKRSQSKLSQLFKFNSPQQKTPQSVPIKPTVEMAEVPLLSSSLASPFPSQSPTVSVGPGSPQSPTSVTNAQISPSPVLFSSSPLASSSGSTQPMTKQLYRFQSSSPDDIAFLNMLQACGLSFSERTSEWIEVKCGQFAVKFIILAILPFSSARRRMGIVVRFENGTIHVFVKGADSTILPLCEGHPKPVSITIDDENEIDAETKKGERNENTQNPPKITQSAPTHSSSPSQSTTTTVDPLSELTPNRVYQETVQGVDHMSRLGLRTLCVCGRQMTQSELDRWLVKWKQAECSIEDRSTKMDETFAEIEKDMTILGCTGVEDKLQDGCSSTIDFFLSAGVRVWILTGDKVDTAVNIGFSCELLKSTTRIHRVTAKDMEEFERWHRSVLGQMGNVGSGGKGENEQEKKLAILIEVQLGVILLSMGVDETEFVRFLSDPGKVLLSQLAPSLPPPIPPKLFSKSQKHSKHDSKHKRTKNTTSTLIHADPEEMALVVDGWAINQICASDPLIELLLLVTDRCSGVVCCRIAPMQKALIVRMVSVKRKAITLAVGDGANDVSMIQEAAVGVGIQGVEGLHASQNSDYSIAQFRHLQRLCCVHGHHNLHRLADLIKFSFFKNVTLSSFLFIYQFSNGMSQSISFEENFGMLFNLIFTSVPIMVNVMTDKDVWDWVLMKSGDLYGLYRTGWDMGLLRVIGWPVFGFVVGFLMMRAFVVVFGFGDLTTEMGAMGQYDHFVGMGGTTILVLVSLVVMWFADFWSFFNFFFVILSLTVYLITMIVINLIRPASPKFFHSLFHMLRSPLFYLMTLSLLVAFFLPFSMGSYIRRRFFPTPRDKVRGAFGKGLRFQHSAPEELDNVKYIKIL